MIPLATTASLTATLTLITVMLGLLGYIGKVARAAFKAIDGHLEAMHENTQAIQALESRVGKLEHTITDTRNGT